MDRPSNSRLLTPGSVVRIPVGFVWIGIVVVVILMVIAFLMGSRRGFEEGRLEGQQVGRSMEEVARTATLRREPSLGTGPSQPESTLDRQVASPARPPSSPQREPAPGSSLPLPDGAEGLDRSIDIEVERRRPGWTYKVVLYTKLQNAREVARSIREKGRDLGVDAMVKRSQNGQLGTVILLPGTPGRFTEQQMIEWERRIEELAERVADEPVWRGQRPFTGHYAEPFGE